MVGESVGGREATFLLLFLFSISFTWITFFSSDNSFFFSFNLATAPPKLKPSLFPPPPSSPSSPSPSASPPRVNKRPGPLQHASPVPIPRILHFCYAEPPSGAAQISFMKWLSMTSAVRQLQPKRIMFHCEVGRLPVGFWWRKFSQDFADRIQVVEHDPVDEVYGHPVQVLAHKTDVMRLEGIYNHGGIYLDSDVLVFHDFLPELNDHLRQHPDQEVVLGKQYDGSTALGSAVLVARPFSSFMAMWKRGYYDFNDNKWAKHSVGLAKKLQNHHPELVYLLPDTSFYTPEFNQKREIEELWTHELDEGESPVHDFKAVNAMGWHWWGHAIKGSLIDRVNPCLMLNNCTAVSQMVGQHVTPDLCEAWKAGLTKS